MPPSEFLQPRLDYMMRMAPRDIYLVGIWDGGLCRPPPSLAMVQPDGIGSLGVGSSDDFDIDAGADVPYAWIETQQGTSISHTAQELI